jgi:hypothetical protein
MVKFRSQAELALIKKDFALIDDQNSDDLSRSSQNMNSNSQVVRRARFAQIRAYEKRSLPEQDECFVSRQTVGIQDHHRNIAMFVCWIY